MELRARPSRPSSAVVVQGRLVSGPECPERSPWAYETSAAVSDWQRYHARFIDIHREYIAAQSVCLGTSMGGRVPYLTQGPSSPTCGASVIGREEAGAVSRPLAFESQRLCMAQRSARKSNSAAPCHCSSRGGRRRRSVYIRMSRADLSSHQGAAAASLPWTDVPWRTPRQHTTRQGAIA